MNTFCLHLKTLPLNLIHAIGRHLFPGMGNFNRREVVQWIGDGLKAEFGFGQ